MNNQNQQQNDAFLETFENYNFPQIFKEYYSTGKLLVTISKRNNLLDGKLTLYYESGQISKEKWYINGEQSGICREYYRSGQLECETYYIKDQLNGKAIQYYKSGNKFIEKYYDNGKLHGYFTVFSESGQIEKSDEYYQGNLAVKSQIPLITNETTCPICIEPINNMINPIALLCDSRHVFCKSCINNYNHISYKAKCPLCKLKIK